MARRPSVQTRRVLDALVADAARWRFGYELSRETGIASGTLYPLLGRLSERGYLESRWEQTVPGRPPRHLYRLTPHGNHYIRDLQTADVGDPVPAGAVGQGA